MFTDDRRSHLLELIRVKRFASLPDLAGELHVSESTVRRDVELLEDQGSVRRIHGGVLYAGVAPSLPHFEARQPTHWAEKRAIAREAVKLIEPGDTVLLDGGSTTYEVARLLVGQPMHVITNSLPVANLFASDPTSDLVFIGGNICPRTGVAQGPYADKMLAALRVRKTFLSVAAVAEEGFFNNNLLLVATEQAMMKAADQAVIVADSSKFGRQSLAYLCRLSDVGHLVVDGAVQPEWQEKIAAAGVNLVVAPETQSQPTQE